MILAFVINNSQFSPEKENGLLFGGFIAGRGTDQLKICWITVRTNEQGARLDLSDTFTTVASFHRASTALSLTSRSYHQLSVNARTWQSQGKKRWKKYVTCTCTCTKVCRRRAADFLWCHYKGTVPIRLYPAGQVDHYRSFPYQSAVSMLGKVIMGIPKFTILYLHITRVEILQVYINCMHFHRLVWNYGLSVYSDIIIIT